RVVKRYVPVVAERRDGPPVLRFESREPVAGRDVDDALVTASISPVRQAASRELTWCEAGPLAFAQTVRPHQLARFRIERDDGSTRARRRVNDAVDHQRRPFELVFREGAERAGLEAPRDA